MSIQTEITRLNTAKANILTSISNKGVDTSSVNTLNDIPPLIDSITGGGSGNGGDYNIVATIDGNTQELAITDADGGSGGNEPQNIFTNDYSQIGYAGTYIKSNGYTTENVLWSDLTPYTGQNATWYVTNPIPIKANTWYKYEGFSSGNNPGACFLGADQTTIYDGFVYKYNGNFKTPSEARYIVMTVNKPYLETMSVKELTEVEKAQLEIDSLLKRTITTYTNDRITSVGNNAFHNCTSLVEVNLPNVTTLGNSSFNNCTSLVSINIPLVTSITTQTFYSCTALTELIMPSLTTVGSQAVRNSKNLAYVDLGVCTSLGALSFDGCTALETLVVRTTKVCTLVNTSALSGTKIAGGTGYIYVPDTLLAQYQEASNWSTFASQIKGLSEL